MSIVKWIDAGVTGSFGTVVEPTADLDKFPNTTVMLPEYFKGATLLEAYWKSVKTPGEGNFVGDPLARPWKPTFTVDAGTLRSKTTGLAPGRSYAIESEASAEGPWTLVQPAISAPGWRVSTIEVEHATAKFYRLVERP